MKYLLMVLAILMFGCGTDTEVVEETPPAPHNNPTRKYLSFTKSGPLCRRIPATRIHHGLQRVTCIPTLKGLSLTPSH